MSEDAEAAMKAKVRNQELLEMCLEHFNEPMISFGEVRRCIGYAETGVDCYIITRLLHGKIVWNTCVGGYTFLHRLKGQEYVLSYAGEEWDDLYRLSNTLALNGCPPEAEFMLELRHDDMENSRNAVSPHPMNVDGGYDGK